MGGRKKNQASKNVVPPPDSDNKTTETESKKLEAQNKISSPPNSEKFLDNERDTSESSKNTENPSENIAGTSKTEDSNYSNTDPTKHESEKEECEQVVQVEIHRDPSPINVKSNENDSSKQEEPKTTEGDNEEKLHNEALSDENNKQSMECCEFKSETDATTNEDISEKPGGSDVLTNEEEAVKQKKSQRNLQLNFIHESLEKVLELVDHLAKELEDIKNDRVAIRQELDSIKADFKIRKTVWEQDRLRLVGKLNELDTPSKTNTTENQ